MANQEEKFVKIATQQKQTVLASSTSIETSVNHTASVINGSSYYNNKNNNSSSESENNYRKQQHQQQQQTIQQNNNKNFRATNIRNIDNNGINNITVNGTINVNKSNNSSGSSENFSSSFVKNFAKIRQHDSDVSPRPRRPYQNDSSSRYYNKSSDVTGQGRIIGDSSNIRSGTSGVDGGGGGGRRHQYINNNTQSDYNNINQSIGGGYNRSNTPPDPNKGGGINNTGGYNNKPHVRSNSPYQSQSGGYNNRYNNGGGGQNNYYQKYENGGGGRSSYNNSRDEYSPSISPSLNGERGGSNNGGGPRLGPRNFGGDNRLNSNNTGNNRGQFNDNNGPRRPTSNNYNSLDRNERLDSRSDQQQQHFNRSDRIDRGGGERFDRSERFERGSERIERGGDRLDRVDRNTLPSALRSDNWSQDNRQPISERESNYSPHSSAASPAAGSPKSGDLRENAIVTAQGQTSIRRWVPPSLRPQHGLTQNDKNDAIFRKVRGILNKLTPEKFQELSDDLLKVDLNSTVVLQGVILLIFDKALDEPKYSSMYAQLCKRLYDEAPKFDDHPKDSHPTFLRLLLNICRDKFLSRSTNPENITTTPTPNDNKSIIEKDKEYYYKEDDEVTSEEEERRHVVKQRMLGNVKFIGELSKLQMLSHNILHKCVQQLLDKKQRPDSTLQDRCEDMECLCQLIRTCGKDMDTEQSKKLMDQYFKRMDQRSKSQVYPPRIRFMLRDIIELRDNKWIPRKVTSTEGPVPIRQIRTDDDSVIRAPYNNHRNRDMRNNDRDSDNWMNRLPLNLQSSGFNDMFSSLTSSSPLMSPGYSNNNRHNQRNNQNNYNNYNNNNRFNKHNNNNQLNNLHNNSSIGGGMILPGSSQYNQMMNNKDLAPRFKKTLITAAQESVENLQMRPSANSLLFKANMNIKPPMLPISTPLAPSGISTSNSNNTSGQSTPTLLSLSRSDNLSNNTNTSGNNSGGIILSVSTPLNRSTAGGGGQNDISSSSYTPLNTTSSSISTKSIPLTTNSSLSSTQPATGNNIKDKDIMLVTKQGSTEKQKQGKKDKGPGKDEIMKKVVTFLNENLLISAKEKEIITDDVNNDDSIENNEEQNNIENNKSLEEIITDFNELKIADKFMKDCAYTMLNEIVDKTDIEHEKVIEFLQLLRKDNKLQSNSLLEAFRQIINKMNEKEATIPRITTLVASLLARSVNTKLCKLSDVASYTDGGQHYPLILLVLQQLHKTMGRDALEDLFASSKVNLMASLPEADRNKERLAEILEDRNLTFLYPLLKVQQEMLKQIQTESNPQSFYKWIKSNVDAKYHKDSGFITALMTVILKFITQETSLVEGTDIKTYPEKSIIDKEEALFAKYCDILEAFLSGSTDLQLVAVYALQVFCYNVDFPKGMLCRWFKNLYEANVIEEEAFLRWKEEVTDVYPGKGTALFQVNQWLTWLEQAESEDED